MDKEIRVTHTENDQDWWNGIYRIGGAAAIGAVVIGIAEIVITFLPGGNAPHETVLEWFSLFHDNWFMGLRDLGLLNIMLDVVAIPLFFALYTAHRQSPNRPYATLAFITALLGIGIFYATNRAFPMLALSQQYAAAETDAQRTIIEAAGQAMLSVGQSHTAGTFLAFFFTEAAGVMMSVVMLRSGIFNKVSAYTGMLGFGILLIFEFLSSFVSGLSTPTMALAMFGGLLSMAWYLLTAQGLFRLGRNPGTPS
jgi:hypothetical protein